MKKVDADHVTVTKLAGTDFFHCERCRTRQEFTLPMPIDEWVKLCRTFSKAHKNCKPKVTK